MKYKFLFYALLSLFALSCEEVPPVVTGAMDNSGPVIDVDDQQRQVLIEEFTGVRCVNCPAGSALIEDLLAANGVQLIAVSIHAGEFSPPYNNSQYDFRTPEGNSILSYLGEPFGYPTAVVNRKLFDGEFDLQLGKTQWAGYVAQEKAIEPVVKIGMTSSYDEVTREVGIDISLFPQETITDPDVRLSVMFTESGIEDLQLTPADATPQADYKHKHVLRGMATNYDGQPITESLTAGSVIEESINFTLPQEWQAENCKIIAFVSLGAGNKEVLQAHEIEVIEP